MITVNDIMFVLNDYGKRYYVGFYLCRDFCLRHAIYNMIQQIFKGLICYICNGLFMCIIGLLYYAFVDVVASNKL